MTDPDVRLSIQCVRTLFSECLLRWFVFSAIFGAVFLSHALARDLSNESSWFWNEDRLIKDSPNVFLVKIKSYSQNNRLETNYKAEIIETLKTNDPSRFHKTAEVSLEKFAPPDTDIKSWEKGWGKRSGRAIHTKACEIWVPFTVGKSYLTFLGRQLEFGKPGCCILQEISSFV